MNDQLIMFEPHNIMQCIILSHIQYTIIILDIIFKYKFEKFVSELSFHLGI